MKMHSFPNKIIFITGTPRSGTSWLGTILSSYENSLYSHEPTTKCLNKYFIDQINNIKFHREYDNGCFNEIIKSWSRAHHDSLRPPFFKKKYERRSVKYQWIIWMFSYKFNILKKYYLYKYSPPFKSDFDLVIKEVGWNIGLENICRFFADYYIGIIRHPCAVVASQKRGSDLSILANKNLEDWFDINYSICNYYNFEKKDILSMNLDQYRSLRWLVENHSYVECAEKISNSSLIVYENLCKNPIETVEKLFKSIGWELHKQTANYIYESSKKNSTKISSFLRGKNPYFDVYKNSNNSMNKWKNNLNELEIKNILDIATRHKRFYEFWPENS